MNLLEPGQCERFKGAYHNTLWWLLLWAGLYNGGAWIARGSTHSAVNAGVYGLLVYWEGKHVAHHASACK